MLKGGKWLEGRGFPTMSITYNFKTSELFFYEQFYRKFKLEHVVEEDINFTKIQFI